MNRKNATFLAAAAAVSAIAARLPAQVPVIDGTRDATYGAPFSVQTVNTGFGDNQSELDAGYLKIQNGKLYLFLSGNLESNFNKMVLFFDTRPGGQNVMRNDNPNVDFDNVNRRYAGMTFDAGFAPDYMLFYSRDANNVYLNFTELNTNGGGRGDFLGQVATPNPNQQGAGTVGGTAGLPRVDFGYNDANVGGVNGNAPTAADQTAAAAVTTGSEIAIDLSQLGATENFTMMIGINGSSHDFWSNQFLPGLIPPQGNLGSDGLGNFVEPGGTGTGGTVGLVNFNNIAGNQFLTVNYHAPLSQWNSTNGNWSEAAKWTGDGVPNQPDARAVLGTLGGSGAKSIALDIDVALQSLTFDNPGGYTITPVANHAFTITGNPATPAVRVISGSHTIGAPVILGATTNFGVDVATSQLSITGALTATGQTIVKSGLGTLQINNARADGLHVTAGTVSIATNGSNSGASQLGFLNIDAGASLDLKDNDLIVQNASYDTITALIKAARANGAWTGTGITSNAAKASVPANKTLGTLTGVQYKSISPNNTTFDGFTVNDTDVIVKFTYYGDSDLNGKVNFDDYARIDAGFNSGGTDWFHGDFDYNNKVNFDDYALIDAAFNSQSGTLRPAMALIGGGTVNPSDMDLPGVRAVAQHLAEFGPGYGASFLRSVPEPTTAAVFGLAALSAIARRRRAH